MKDIKGIRFNCPFCGGEVCIRRTPDYGSEKPRLFATCCVCGVETPRIARSRKEAVAAWNRRAQPDDLLTSTRRAQPTNADRIRGMSDEELADFIFLSPEMEFEICRYCTNGNPTPTDDRGQCLRDGGRCYANDACDAFKNWLRKPAEEEHNG